MQIELAFVPPVEAVDVAVVIDVLRMTTTAATLLTSGLDELYVVADEEEARELGRATGALVLGERGGLPCLGFDGGNSPLDYSGRDLTGRKAVLCTTNGSKAVEAAAGARSLLLGSIVNAPAVGAFALESAEESITLLCAGTDGQPSLDDVLGAGSIIRAIAERDRDARLSDSALMAFELAAPGQLASRLSKARHALTLKRLGFAADVDFAGELGRFSVVPRRTGSAPASFGVALPQVKVEGASEAGAGAGGKRR